MNDTDEQRRQFLKTSVGAAAVAIAPGMLMFDMAHGDTEPVSSKVRWGMLIDTENCADCDKCVKACNKEPCAGIGTALGIFTTRSGCGMFPASLSAGTTGGAS